MTDTYPPGTPNWVDLGTTDIAGASSFYGTLFGWTHEDYGPDMGNYGMFLKDGKQVAGIGPATDAERGSSWSTYFATADADAVAAKVSANGGSVIAAPMDVMDQGRMAAFTDPSGAFFAVWQPGEHKGAELVNEPGSLTWNELSTSDMDAAKAFYPAVLGVRTRDVDMGGGYMYSLMEAGGHSVAGAELIGPISGPKPVAWEVYFAVDDCDATYAKALDLGATPTSEPMDSPPGKFASVLDPQGAAFAFIKNNPDFTA